MDIHVRVDAAVQKLRPTCTLDAINAALVDAFGGNFRTVGYPVDPSSSVARYTDAIRRGFYDADRQELPADYRESALIALLAAQDAEDNLAIHVFIGLMAGLNARAVVDLVYLTGIYCGVNVLTRSLRVVMKTFDALLAAAENVPPPPPQAVIGAIVSQFPDQKLADARGRLQKLAAE